jgi:hypothetical protein
MRIRTLAMLAAGILSQAGATTLQQLSMDDMIRKSTAIVRAKVVDSRAAFRGQDIYTYYKLQVLEGLTSGAQQLEVAVPGGSAKGMRQMVPGAPTLNVGSEYVIFLWTSRSGLTQVIGLSQGLFTVSKNAAGDTMLVRPAATELMLDKSGHEVQDEPVSLHLNAVRSQIRKTREADR